MDFLFFNETMGITLATASVSGAVVTAAVFVIFLCYRQTPLVRASCQNKLDISMAAFDSFMHYKFCVQLNES